MKNYEAKEEKVVNNILKTIENLDQELAKLETLEQDTKKHALKKWFVEKKALHEIKRILHEAKYYEKYDDKEILDFESYINSVNI
jgi:hypothetical protein